MMFVLLFAASAVACRRDPSPRERARLAIDLPPATDDALRATVQRVVARTRERGVADAGTAPVPVAPALRAPTPATRERRGYFIE